MIEWKEGAVCYAVGWQRYSTSYVISGLTNGVTTTDDYKDFQLNEIRIGDYIEKSELDTEQKYNDVVEVFGLFGFEFEYKQNEYTSYEYIFNGDQVSLLISNGGYIRCLKLADGRKLTYNQIMAIGKLKRMMNEKPAAKSAPKTTPEVSADKLKTSTDYLNECIEVQAERGKQYDSSGTGERSFDAAAKAFNALTGEKLSGSDVCLLLACVKVVRQNSDKSRLHDDSLLDGVSYLSLWAEELNKELS
jgi:hypothetical protein